MWQESIITKTFLASHWMWETGLKRLSWVPPSVHTQADYMLTLGACPSIVIHTTRMLWARSSSKAWLRRTPCGSGERLGMQWEPFNALLGQPPWTQEHQKQPQSHGFHHPMSTKPDMELCLWIILHMFFDGYHERNPSICSQVSLASSLQHHLVQARLGIHWAQPPVKILIRSYNVLHQYVRDNGQHVIWISKNKHTFKVVL